jgi:hypothetical protein
MAIEVKIGEPKPDYQGIWKSYEESHAATFHGYGLGIVDWKCENREQEIKEAAGRVMLDLFEKIRLLAGETIFKSYGVYNYGRFFDRYAIKATVSLFYQYEKLGDLYSKDLTDYFTFFHKKELLHFFGRGEFPFIEYGYIHRENGEKLIVYFLSR